LFSIAHFLAVFNMHVLHMAVFTACEANDLFRDNAVIELVCLYRCLWT